MGSLTLNVQKKQHRERAQPLDRKKLGFLEKKKDYKIRAKDHHIKESRLKYLRRQAEFRNPDEYHHDMAHSVIRQAKRRHKNRRDDDDDMEDVKGTMRNARTKGKGLDGAGVFVFDPKKGPVFTKNTLSADAVKLLKTQDSAYIQTNISKEKKAIERLEAETSTFFNKGTTSTGKHTVFVDSEQEAKTFDPVKYFDTDKKLLKRRENRLRKSQLEETAPATADDVRGIVVGTDSRAGLTLKDSKSTRFDEKTQMEMNKRKLAKLTELQQRLERETELAKVKNVMDMSRELLKKGARRKVTDKDGYSTYVWANERKR